MTRRGGVHLDGFRFAMIPEEVLYGDLPDRAVRVYGVLLRHGAEPTSCWPSHTRIAGLIRCSKNSVIRAIDELVAAGWVTVHARRSGRGQTSNGYTVHQTPLPMGGYPPLPTGGYPPYPPVGTEREQLNESHLNETPQTPQRDPRPPRPNPTRQGKQTGWAEGWAEDWAVVARLASQGSHDWVTEHPGLSDRGRKAAHETRSTIRRDSHVSAKHAFRAAWQALGAARP